MRTEWTESENDYLRIQAVSLTNQGRVSKEKLTTYAAWMNQTFHQGKTVRTSINISSAFYTMRRQLRKGEEITGRNKATKDPCEKQIWPTATPSRTPSATKDKTYSSETLTRMVRCAKEIKKTSCTFLRVGRNLCF
jgi:hypothetical protein